MAYDAPGAGGVSPLRRSAWDSLTERMPFMAKKKAVVRNRPRTKGGIVRELADRADLKRAQVVSVFDEMSRLIKADLGKNGPGVFTVPGLLKIKVVRKPATKARKGTNPFTGEEMMFKAKPARNVVKCLALKGLKDLVPKK